MKRLATMALLFAACQKPNWNPDPPWPHVPITVEWSGISGVFDSSIASALGAWNYAAHCDHELLREAADPWTANVTIAAYEGEFCGRNATIEDIPGAVAGYSRCSSDRAEIRFRVMSDLRSVFVTACHELGHMLGLSHDTSALMQQSPPLEDTASFGAVQRLMPWPSDADGAAVGSRYCGGLR
jgi:hypothetical protein